MVKVITLACIHKTMAHLVVLLITVTMAAFDSIASDIFGLMERLINFQKPQKPHWSHHYIPSY